MSEFDADFERADLELEEPLTRAERLAERIDRAQFYTYSALALLLILVSLMWQRVFIYVAPGHQGVMFRLIEGGIVTDGTWGEGLHAIPPWDHIQSYECRLQEETLSVEVLSLEGIDVGVTLSIRYRPVPEHLGFLHRDVGPDYFDRLVKPEVLAHIRRTFGERPALEVYASEKDLLQELAKVPVLGRVAADAQGTMRTLHYVEVEEIKLLDIEMPELVKTAIADKYRQEQLMLEYQYRLRREEQEAERKRTEAAGVRDYTAIVGTITKDVLQWRGIEANIELARSNNAKVVVFNGGEQGVPMMINLEDSHAAPDSPAPPGNAAVPTAPTATRIPGSGTAPDGGAAPTPPK